MILAENVSRRFGRVHAVAGVTFSIKRGKIVGFLGPNGAGKTTTLRMLASYVRPTSGRLLLDGMDLMGADGDVRTRVGYLPENVPLYLDMRVQEYLRFRGRVKGMNRSQIRARMAFVLEACGLEHEQRHVIRTLSKGYRQRVGLADCLLHDPACLLLDEPTAGLDPNQIRQVRSLIRSLAGRHTIVLSTHNLSEVEVLCDEVLIMNRGQVVAAGTPASLPGLLKGDERIVLELHGDAQHIRTAIGGISGVHDVSLEQHGDWCHVALQGPGGGVTRERLFVLACQQAWRLRRLESIPQNLEDVFAALTQETRRLERGRYA